MRTTTKNGYTTVSRTLQEFINTFGALCTRDYTVNGNHFVGMVCVDDLNGNAETFLAAPNPDNGSELEGFPYGGTQDEVDQFLTKHVDELDVLDSTFDETGRRTCTLVLHTELPDTTRKVLGRKTAQSCSLGLLTFCTPNGVQNFHSESNFSD